MRKPLIFGNAHFQTIEYWKKFIKEIDKIFWSFISIYEDLEVFINYWLVQIKEAKDLRNIGTDSVVMLKLHKYDGLDYFIYKIKRFRCKSEGNKTKSHIRLVFCYQPINSTITMLEIYKKWTDDAHKKERVKEYCSDPVNYCQTVWKY